METGRRQWIRGSLLAATAALTAPRSKAALAKFGMPGPYPGRVIAVEHSRLHRFRRVPAGTHPPNDGTRDEGTDRRAKLAGCVALFFEKGDVVGIKVSPVGGAKLCSDALGDALDYRRPEPGGRHEPNIVVFNRYREEAVRRHSQMAAGRRAF